MGKNELKNENEPWERRFVVSTEMFCTEWKFSTGEKLKKAHSKYHLLKSYDYDIIYSPVFVAIYVANRRKFVLT